MATCIKPNLTPSSAYKYYKCRCDRCIEWKRDAAQRTNDKVRAAERSRQWRLENLDRSRENSKRYQRENPEKLLEFQIRKYGLTLEQYYEILEKQNHVCAICKQKCTSKTRLAIDHCHATNKVRGLLCANCNTALGKFRDSPELLLNAISYLEDSK